MRKRDRRMPAPAMVDSRHRVASAALVIVTRKRRPADQQHCGQSQPGKKFRFHDLVNVVYI
jgi:hypothetical protein